MEPLMRTRILPLAVLSIVLAACDNSPPETETDGILSMEEVAERAENSAIKPQPDQYSVSVLPLLTSAQGLPQ